MPITTTQIQATKARISAAGINLSELCRQQHVDYQAARDILAGKSKGHRGEAHKAAVLLGLKPGVIHLHQSSDEALLDSSDYFDDADNYFALWCDEHPRTAAALMQIMKAHPEGDFTVHIPPYGGDVTPHTTDEEMLRLAGNIRPAFFSDELRDS